MPFEIVKFTCMDTKTILIISASLIVVVLIIIIVMVNNTKRAKLKKEVDDLYVRFNTIKTVPIAFKLNKAQAMAKRNDETASGVQYYYEQYEQAEKKINNIQDKLNIIDDDMMAKDYKSVKDKLQEVFEAIVDCEAEIKKIDDFLEEFSKKDNEQREYASTLKEKYRLIKNTIQENAGVLSIAYSGLEQQLQECEELFSTSEEWMYVSDYVSAQNDLDKINEKLETIKVNANAVPKCVNDVIGVIPEMLDRFKREYALTRQRGVYIAHLNIDESLEKIDNTLKQDNNKLVKADTVGIRENCAESKKLINDLNESLEVENRSFIEAKETNNRALEHINDLKKVESYVRIAYDKDSLRFGLEDLRPFLKQQRENIEKFLIRHKDISEEVASCIKPASEILVDAEKLCEDIESDKKNLYTYKTIIDKSADGETRAASQLIKLQLVVSETETKISKYRLPIISESYKNDLKKSREYIAKLRKLLSEIPIDIDELNVVLDEAIDFIYKFHNNVNNIVGMAIMAENTIVFGNKYRSTYPEIDQELSKAEFQYLNGEYTKAMKTALTCMETLFPDDADEKIMENV